jgi:tetratricopeptide (TPR) repeat protein
MKFRTATTACLLGLGLSSAAAQAAVTVLGNSIGTDCYRAAEYGSEPRDGIQTCTYAIESQALTIRDRAATLINRGILRSRLGDSSGALADYNQGLSLDGSLGEGYVDRGAVYISLQKYDEALNDINKGIELGAREPHIAYYDRAIVDEAQGNIRGAYEDYKKAVELEPDFTLATQQLSRFKVVRKAADGT